MRHVKDYPALHNAMWPGLVGKGPGAEPPIDLDTMLRLTAETEVNGVRFDGVDLFLFEPHVDIDATDDQLKVLADKLMGYKLRVGSVVAPVWPATGGASALSTIEERKKFLTQVRKACRIGKRLKELGVREYGIVRIDSACSPADWAGDPTVNSMRIAETFRESCSIAGAFDERLAVEGEVCWGGIHGWRKVADLLAMVNRPNLIGFQADMAHTLLFLLGVNAPEDRLLPENFDWSQTEVLDEAMKTMTAALRPWTIDFHVAQNDATVKGTGSHDKTGHHCLPNDPNGKLNIVKYAGYWLRDEHGTPTRPIHHMCWDGCMFPNETMLRPETWRDVLSIMIDVRKAHGWGWLEEQRGH